MRRALRHGAPVLKKIPFVWRAKIACPCHHLFVGFPVDGHKLSVTTKGIPCRSFDLKHKNLIAKCSLISPNMIEHKYYHTLKILQVFETLMQLTTPNNERVSYSKTQMEKKTKSKREGIENS